MKKIISMFVLLVVVFSPFSVHATRGAVHIMVVFLVASVREDKFMEMVD